MGAVTEDVRYSEADRELVAKLWAKDGWSAGEIASKAGLQPRRTRNAIIGLVQRMGLMGHGAPRTSSPRPAKVAATAKPKPLRPRKATPAPAARPPEPDTPPVPMLDLDFGDCRWPVGEATGADQLFCGRFSGYAPYCERHGRAGTIPGSARRALTHTAAEGGRRLLGRDPQHQGAKPQPNTAEEGAAGLPRGSSSTPAAVS